LQQFGRKIQLELAKDKEPNQEEQQTIANSNVVKKSPKAKGTLCKG
jgi:hypothetical protein